MATERRHYPRGLRGPRSLIRRWDRMSEFVRLFIATGCIADMRPASLVLVSDPGSGKTELLDRFRVNGQLSYHSDLTVRQLWPELKKAQAGLLTHLVFTELQKVFQRKSSVADNCMGSLVQAMEEGAGTVSVGPFQHRFVKARVGVLAALTNGTLEKRLDVLSEMGFLDRVTLVRFDLSLEEEKEILNRMADGDTGDLTPIAVRFPENLVSIRLPANLGHKLKQWCWSHRQGRILRLFQRVRGLTLAAAYLDNCRIASLRHAKYVMQFEDWLFRGLD